MRRLAKLPKSPVLTRSISMSACQSKFVWEWYHAWADRGQWDKRYAVRGEADLLPCESLSAARVLTTPCLMIHNDDSFVPEAARRHSEAMLSARKQLLWEGDTPHPADHDQPAILDRPDGPVAPQRSSTRQRHGLDSPAHFSRCGESQARSARNAVRPVMPCHAWPGLFAQARFGRDKALIQSSMIKSVTALHPAAPAMVPIVTPVEVVPTYIAATLQKAKMARPA